ncbi:tyrosinase family protein [Naasia sp. SYSU D00948]|uniref:tyrosinase family protein n=1 Tax=Naasia sp. SYSU D00948 TaxID=2817379 RepID=UPI001B317FB0|nr:tyrosinase family protein [Naasia sp. SYSU D00948]
MADRTSWLFLAAIHGIQPSLWFRFGVIEPDVAAPPAADQRRFWNQCQHQSWYFLPWHRGYLFAFEQICREAVIEAGGPEDWALPYWNYSDTTRPEARVLPDAFAQETLPAGWESTALPDGSPNPLWVERRYGKTDPPITIGEQFVTLEALQLDDFVGGTNDIPPGFGGPVTVFHTGGGPNGSLERQPHNGVHGQIGGSRPGGNVNDPADQGFMSMPSTAGLDPIFWLHHANIDRLWTVWRRTHTDPADPRWLDGPIPRTFTMPAVDGQEWTFTPSLVLDTASSPLDYIYDDQAAPVEPVFPVGARRAERFALLSGGPARSADDGTPSAEEREGGVMGAEHAPELIGASDSAVRVNGETRAGVRLDEPRVRSLTQRLGRAMALGPVSEEPPRVFLKLEGIRGTSDAANYLVYIGLPTDATEELDPDHLAGTLSLFGVGRASDPEGPNAGGGLNEVLEITRVVDALQVSGNDLANALDVRFVPASERDADADFSISSVRVFMLEP